MAVACLGAGASYAIGCVGAISRSKFDKFTMVDPLGADEEEVRISL